MTGETVCYEGLGFCYSSTPCEDLKDKVQPGFLNMTLSDGGVNNSISMSVNED